MSGRAIHRCRSKKTAPTRVGNAAWAPHIANSRAYRTLRPNRSAQILPRRCDPLQEEGAGRLDICIRNRGVEVDDVFIAFIDQCVQNYSLELSRAEADFDADASIKVSISSNTSRRTPMSRNIQNTSRQIEPDRTSVSSSAPSDNGNVPNNVFDAMMRASPCSPMVFYGLLAWAKLTAQTSSGQQGPTRKSPGSLQ